MRNTRTTKPAAIIRNIKASGLAAIAGILHKPAKIRLCIGLAALLMITAIFLPSKVINATAADDEFRGVWVPTVLSLNYPANKTTDPTLLQKDAIDIIEQVKDLGFNAIFFQVRPSADAFYKSSIFPWSKYLTGIQGLEPDHNFDPLIFFIEAARERGIQVHAWINPYRITAEKDDAASLAAGHPARLHPEWTVTYTDGKMYWNPGIPEVQQLIADGVKEIVDNYNIDGIHIDDYFYPGADFDDAAAFETYGKGKYASLTEWRLANTELTVKNMYDVVHSSGRDLVFGVSPMGIWANKSTSSLGSATKGGESYTQRFADTRGWVKRGIVDYIAPQIYWNIGFEIAEYKTLVDWWSGVTDGTKVKLYIGQAAYRTGNESTASPWHGVSEIQRQVEYNRTKAGVNGYIMYSFASFADNIDLYSLMQALNHKELADSLPIVSLGEDEQNDQNNQNSQNSQNVQNTVAVPVFSDLKDHWAVSYINAMAERGFIKGYPEGYFKPDAPIKRADFVLMLMGMLPYDVSGKSADAFLDIAPDAYYLNALRDARRMGFITGAGDNMFFPEDEITRQDMMTIAHRALTMSGYMQAASGPQPLNAFKDRAAVADYALIPMSTLVEQGYVNGIDGALEPMKSTTRAETATLLYRFYEAFLKAA